MKKLHVCRRIIIEKDSTKVMFITLFLKSRIQNPSSLETNKMNSAYIDQNGIIQRNGFAFPQLNLRKPRSFTLILILSIGIASFLTNPGNSFSSTLIETPFVSSMFSNHKKIFNKHSSGSKKKKIGSINLSWIGYEMDIFESPTLEQVKNHLGMNDDKLTNFVFFSLSKRARDGVYISAFFHKWRLCEFGDNDIDLEHFTCEHIGKPFFIE